MPHTIFRVGLKVVNYGKGESYKTVEGGRVEVLSLQNRGRTCSDITLMQGTEFPSLGVCKDFGPVIPHFSTPSSP